jgi:hypothetical protein
MKSTNPVDIPLFVAMAIYHLIEVNKEPAHLKRIVEFVQDYVTKQNVWHAMDTLDDWMIIYGEYGLIGNGHAGRLHFIETHDGGDFRIKELHDKYWKQITGEV